MARNKAAQNTTEDATAEPAVEQPQDAEANGDSPVTQEVAVMTYARSLMDALIAPNDRPALRRVSSLDLTSDKGRAMMFNSEADCTLSLNDQGSVTLNLADWIVHECDIPSLETGELVRVLRTVLIDTDGNTYATTSPIVAQRLSRLLDDLPGRKLDKPITVQVIERRSKRGKTTYHNLIIVP